MAKIGLRDFKYAIMTDETAAGVPTYGTVKSPGKAIDCSVETSSNSAELQADDVLRESDYSFQEAKVKITIDDDDQVMLEDLMGQKVTDGAMVRKVDDAAPYVGFGRIITKMVGGVLKYKVEFLYKVKFAEPSQSEKTRGKGLEFGTTELNGTASALADGRWSVTQTFTGDNGRAAAEDYLAGLFVS